MAKSVFDLEENISALLSYLSLIIFPIFGIVVLFMDKENKFARFHAAQSILLYVVFLILGVLSTVTCGITGIVALIIWIFMMWKAYSGEYYKLPVIGDLSESLMEKIQ